MAEPTRITMTPNMRAWCFDKMLKAGYSQEQCVAGIDKGDWKSVPLREIDVNQLTCRSCGEPPYRDSGGRIHLGCPGSCKQRAFADIKDRNVEDRYRRAAGAVHDPMMAAVSQDGDLWGG